MSGVFIDALAFNKAQYLSQRQAVIAENIANADTPGFRARDLPSFEDVLAANRSAMSESAGPLPADLIREASFEIASTEDSDSLSGNSVNVEKQMSALSEVNKSYALTANITRAFNQMFSAVAK